MNQITYYHGDDLYPIGDSRNRRRETHVESVTPSVYVPTTPEQWLEIDRKKAELKETLRALYLKYDKNNMDY